MHIFTGLYCKRAVCILILKTHLKECSCCAGNENKKKFPAYSSRGARGKIENLVCLVVLSVLNSTFLVLFNYFKTDCCIIQWRIYGGGV